MPTCGKPEENPNPSLYLVTEDGKTVGETDLNTASELCDFTDAISAHTIDIYANTNGPRYNSKDIQNTQCPTEK